jgi:hypothetical protein
MLREISNNNVSLPGLFVTESADLPFMKGVKVRSYLIKRDSSVAAIYNSPGLSQDTVDIGQLGTPEALLMSHWHETVYRAPRLEMPAYVQKADLSQAKASMPKVEDMAAYSGDMDAIEIVPAPGHTAGFAMFLWTCGDHRVLFSGDAIWMNDGRWEAVVLGESDRERYIASLETVAELDFDVLIPWVYQEGQKFIDMCDRASARRKVLDIIDRVRNGERA